MSDISDTSLYSKWELVEDSIKYETRRKTVIVGGYGPVVYSGRQARRIRTKTYECTIHDVDPDVAELPAPSYLAGNLYIEPNPESLSPTGWGEDHWHPIDIQYTKVLSEPMSRKMRVTWETRGSWFPYDDEESDSSL